MYKMRMIFQKSGAARYISHLDLMQTFQRAFARANIPIWKTEGFNKHAYVSIALPLSVGFGGNREVLDFNLDSETIPTDLTERMNAALPHGIKILSTEEKQRAVKDIAYGKYIITFDVPENQDIFAEQLKKSLTEDTLLAKRCKTGEKIVRLGDFMHPEHKDITISTNGNSVVAELISAAGENSLSPNSIINYIKDNIKSDIRYSIVRDMLLDCNCKSFC